MKHPEIKYLIGIDPGVKTGIAVWDRANNCYMAIESMGIIQAMDYIFCLTKQNIKVKVVVEDARLRKWYGGKDASHKAQGAGSIKRDASIWEEFFIFHSIFYEMIHPIKGGTKMDANMFKKITGWQGRTSEHARDAAMIVYQRNIF